MKIAFAEITQFALSEIEIQKKNDWLKEHSKTCPKVDYTSTRDPDGSLTYSFTPTSLGTFSSVRCVCGASLELETPDYL